MPFRKAVLSLAVLLAAAPLALAQGTYTQFDVPGALSTNCTGINTAGDIVGEYYISGWVGFLLQGGTYTTLIWNNDETAATGLNDRGRVVGVGAGVMIEGWLYDVATQTFTDIIYPGATYTYPSSINDAGTIAGLFEGSVNGGFELAGSTFTEIMFPGLEYTAAYAIDGSAEVFGVAGNNRHSTTFVYRRGQYREISIPSLSTPVVQGTNRTGTALVGYYTSSSGQNAGFLYQNKTVTTLQFPGAIFTIASGINDAGEVVGTFEDTSLIEHGFTWTPPADTGKK
jgi:probable HAF family extracellular repeat protein